MWTGVTKELAGIKFSLSPKNHGLNKDTISKMLTANTHPTKSLTAKYGIALIKLVITVAPQNDICPHGKT